jgi:phosphate transport system protein
MMSGGDLHIMAAFDRDLKDIQGQLVEMSELVSAAILGSAEALRRGNEPLAEQVRRNDARIDELDMHINESCAQVIALRQPAAKDLRLVLSVMRASHNLERIGDYAKNIAKRGAALVAMDPVDGAGVTISKMAGQVNEMLADTMKAFVERDGALADQVRQNDVDVDQMYNAMFRELLTFMMEDPRSISACMHLHFAAKNIERMGDHVTAIAEQVTYILSGDLPDNDRPKASSV